jgi:UDP-2,4-diacetamido-2,4,6-trideoxy-beta-L-altropyranose hydrolase
MPEAVPGTMVIRADAGPGIGTGHVMRCLALAVGLRGRGAPVEFLGKAPPAVVERVCEEGFHWQQIDKTHPNPSDLTTTRDLLTHRSASWLILDGYHFTPQYQSSVRAFNKRLLVVDDDARHEQYDVDILLNQNLSAASLQYRFASSSTRVLFGPHFALLRPEFSRTNMCRDIPQHAERLLVTMGGTDPAEGAFLALEALRRLAQNELTVRIVAGIDNPRMHELTLASRELGPRVEVLGAVGNMAEHLAWADMALTASGSTVWEMCCLGLPMLLIVTASNQLGIAKALHQHGAAVSLGEIEYITPDMLTASLKKFLGDPSLRQALSQAGKQLVDGRGAARVAEILLDSR